MTRRSERAFLLADLAAVDRLLAGLTEEDVVSKFGLEARRDELVTELSELATVPVSTQAEISLFFAGRPVDANWGITADFSIQALAAYQDAVRKVSAFQRFGSLGDRGVVAGGDQSLLYVTDVVRGSFGFQFAESERQMSTEVSILKRAVDEASNLLISFSSTSEDEYASGIQELDQRVVDSISAFFNVLSENDTTVRIVAESVDRWIDKSAITRALERTRSIKIVVDDDVRFEGTLTGVLPSGSKFDFSSQGSIISGTLGREIINTGLERLQTEWLHQTAVAKMQVRSVQKPGREPKLYYTLIKVEPFES